MTKEDLKTGDIVMLRDESFLMYFDNYAGFQGLFIGIFKEEYMHNDCLCENMKNKNGLVDYDIVRIYRPKGPYAFPRSKESIFENYKIVFDKKKKKISMSDAIKRLSEIEGCEVEIV